jgi:glycosyltransferase involved in cell wall biosynthesis
MVKILFYNHTGQVGGAERLLLTLLQRLDRSQFVPVLVCPAEGQLHQLASEAGVRTEAIDGLKARFTWRLDHLVRYLNSFGQVIRDLRRKVIDTQPDLIHANSVRAGLVATLATFGLKQTVIWHIHDLLPRHPFNTFIRLIASLSHRTRILAVAQASADRLVGNLAGLRRRVSVIPNAVDLDKYSTNSNARERIRREVQAEEHDPVIGIIGRLTPAKGQLEMLKLFPKILNRFPNARLLIAGAPAFNNEHEYRELLSRTIVDLSISDHVRMLGSRDDIPDILQALDLLVVNSASEACSLVILEAMASGTPVLATSTGGTPEIIEHEKNGLLVRFGDHDELATRLMTILGDRDARLRLGSQGQRDACARYSISRFMAEMHSLYQSVLAGPKILHEKNLPNLEVTLTSD